MALLIKCRLCVEVPGPVPLASILSHVIFIRMYLHYNVYQALKYISNVYTGFHFVYTLKVAQCQ